MSKTFEELLKDFAAAGNDGGDDGGDGGKAKEYPKDLESAIAKIKEMEALQESYESGIQAVIETESETLSDKQKALLDPLYAEMKAENPLQKLRVLATVKTKVQPQTAGADNSRNSTQTHTQTNQSQGKTKATHERALHSNLNKIFEKAKAKNNQ